MRVLVACEYSGRVREAFRKRGHDAWSCDLMGSEDNSPFHYQQDVFEVIGMGWDLMIAHPPCTYLSLAGNKWFGEKYKERFPNRHKDREDALCFVSSLLNSDIPKIALENPISVISSRIRKPDQIIQPYQFGHPDRKPTCLWLKGLPKIRATKIVEPIIVKNKNGKTASAHHDAALRLPPLERFKARATTYQGIADAFAEQWG